MLPRCVFMPFWEWIFFHASWSEAAVVLFELATVAEGWHAQPFVVVAFGLQPEMRSWQRVGGTG